MQSGVIRVIARAGGGIGGGVLLFYGGQAPEP